MINENLTELPEKWYIKVTNEDNKKILNDYFHSIGPKYSGYNYNQWQVLLNYCYAYPQIIPNLWGHTDDEINNRKGYTEISFEQFKKWVLKESTNLKVEDLIEGEVYSTLNNFGKPAVFKSAKSGTQTYSIWIGNEVIKNGSFNGENIINNLKLATPEEKKWLNVCIKQDKFIPKEELNRYNDVTFELEIDKEYESKFEVGKWYKDIIHYPFLYVKFYEFYDKGFHSSEKITTIGHNYQLNDYWVINTRKWQLLEDLSEIQQYLPDGHVDKINADVIPEYVECIEYNSKCNGKILKTSEPSPFGLSWDEIAKYNRFKDSSFKPSTKEAYDKQQERLEHLLTEEESYKEEPMKYSYEVVHCTTQEEWDFVNLKLDSEYKLRSSVWGFYKTQSCKCFNKNEYYDLQFYKSKNSLILSFEQWCTKFNHNPDFNKPKELNKEELLKEAKRRYPDGCTYKGLNLKEEANGEVHTVFKSNPYWYKERTSISLEEFKGVVYANGKWAEIIESPKEENTLDCKLPVVGKTFENKSEEKSLVGRYLKSLCDYPNSGKVRKNEYGLIFQDNKDNVQANFPSQADYGCTKDLFNKKYQLLPEGFIPEQKEEWIPGVGDWIVVLESQYVGDLYNSGKDFIAQIANFKNPSNYWVKNQTITNLLYNKNQYEKLCCDNVPFRKALPYEIPNSYNELVKKIAKEYEQIPWKFIQSIDLYEKKEEFKQPTTNKIKAKLINVKKLVKN